MKNLIKVVLHAVLLVFGAFAVSAQETMEVKQVFWGERLVDQQTSETMDKGRIRMEILHRFGTINNGISDVFGVYAPSNISMGLAYGITPNFMVEFQSEKNNKIQEVGLKYKILKQTLDNSMPVNLAYYASLAIDARNETVFGEGYSFADRFIYTHQIIVSRQFNYRYFAMLGLAFYHANAVVEQVQNDNAEINLALGYKLNKRHSVFASYQQPLDLTWFQNNPEAELSPLSAMAIGYESATYSHNFQVFLSTRDNIHPEKDMVYNRNPIAFKNLRIGFNIRVYFGKKHANTQKKTSNEH